MNVGTTTAAAMNHGLITRRLVCVGTKTALLIEGVPWA
jgi:hypothetical protein